MSLSLPEVVLKSVFSWLYSTVNLNLELIERNIFELAAMYEKWIIFLTTELYNVYDDIR
jgi:hypothetical protein